MGRRKLAPVPIGLRHPFSTNGAVPLGEFALSAEGGSPSRVSPSLCRARPTNVSNVSLGRLSHGCALWLVPARSRIPGLCLAHHKADSRRCRRPSLQASHRPFEATHSASKRGQLRCLSAAVRQLRGQRVEAGVWIAPSEQRPMSRPN